MISDTKKGGGVFFNIFDPSLSAPAQKNGFVGGVWGGPDQRLIGGCVYCLLDKIMILQGVKPTIQALGVGYANRPKKAQNGGGMWPFLICTGLRAFYLTTSAR